jgi:plasmid stability protein
MSGLLQIRNVPDEVRRILKARAAARGESLNSYLLEVIECEASRPTAAEVFARAAARESIDMSDAVEIIQAGREEREARLLDAIKR